MKKIFFLAALAAMSLGFTACSDDDDSKFTDVFRITYDNEGEDSVETAFVQSTYDAVLTTSGTYRDGSITIQGKDSAACADQLMTLMEKAEETLTDKTFSSHPLVFAIDKAGTRVYDARYGDESNTTRAAVIKKSYPVNRLNIDFYSDNLLYEYAGKIVFEQPPVSEILFIEESPNLNAESGEKGNSVTILSQLNQKVTSTYYIEGHPVYKGETVILQTITDVFIYDATVAEDNQAPDSLTYQGRTYYRSGSETNSINATSGKMCGHNLYIYCTYDQSTGKKMMINSMFTIITKSYFHLFGLFKINTKYAVPSMSDLLTDNDAKSLANRKNYKLEFVPMVSKKNGELYVVNQEANLNEGMGGSYLAMALTYNITDN